MHKEQHMENNNQEFVRRIYSVNLATFVYLITKRFPEVYRDNDGLIYFVYESSEEISIILNVYKNTRPQVDLHAYVEAFKDIKILMRTVK